MLKLTSLQETQYVLIFIPDTNRHKRYKNKMSEGSQNRLRSLSDVENY